MRQRTAAAKKSVERQAIPPQRRTPQKDKQIKATVTRVFEALTDHPLGSTEDAKALSFKLALPGLSSTSEIKSFISHVAQGIALGIFTGREGSQLLYAAQVALGANREPKVKETAKSRDLFD